MALNNLRGITPPKPQGIFKPAHSETIMAGAGMRAMGTPPLPRLVTANAAPIVGDLSIAEEVELERHEVVVGNGLSAFKEVGDALAAIRNKQLYRADYATFEDYLDGRWGISRPRGYQYIAAAEVVNELSSVGSTFPKNEAQARELAGLPIPHLIAAWNTIIQTAPNGRITAEYTKAVVSVLKEIQNTGTFDAGDGRDLPLSEALEARLTQELRDRSMNRKSIIDSKAASHYVKKLEGAPPYFGLLGGQVAQEIEKDSEAHPGATYRVVIYRVESKT